MHPAVLNDSEDEEDLLSGIDGSSISDTAAPRTNQQQSTDSTEQLKRDILNAEHALITSSKEKHVSPRMSRTITTTTRSNVKRSHSELPSDDHSLRSPGQRLKRAKTDRDAISFGGLSGTQDEIVVRCGKHKEALSNSSTVSNIAPAVQSFVNRDVMFNTSGDTVAYTEQTQQRIIENMAQPLATQSSNKTAHKRGEVETSGESSFPWTAHESLISGSRGDPGDNVSTQLAIPDEAHDLIEQYLNFNQPDTTPELSLEATGSSPTLLRHAKTMAGSQQRQQIASQGSQDELAIQSQSQSTNTRGRLRSRKASRQSQAFEVETVSDNPHYRNSHPTLNPADLTLAEAAVGIEPSQEDSSDEIVVAAPHHGHGSAKGNINQMKVAASASVQKPISMAAIVQLLSNESPSSKIVPDVEARMDTEFVVPPVVARKQKQTKKKTPKRSHTTIFEDHIDRKVGHESLTLSQQQAQRKAALETIRNDAKPVAKLRSRRKVAVIDDNDADDHTAPDSVADPTPFGKTATDVESITLRTEDSKSSRQDSAAKTVSESVVTSEGGSNEPTNASPEQACNASGVSKTTAVVGLELPAQSPLDSVMHQQHAKSITLKLSPTTHSPLKQGSSVFRVGLSKRQRIPSLLKIVRPSKQK